MFEFECNEIQLIDDGLGLNVCFKSSNTKIYFLIQKFFGDFEESYSEPVYIESNVEEFIGHYYPKVEISKTYCVVKFKDYKVKIHYEITAIKLSKLKKFLIPLAEISEIV